MQISKIIAIDGPAASGKSTVSKAVAKELSYIYVDSGALYRAVAWIALQLNLDGSDEEKVLNAINNKKWNFFVDEGEVKFSVDDLILKKVLRGTFITDAVSNFAKLPNVRTFVRNKLRSYASLGSLVVEGRDIGSIVFPDATLKFYLDADPNERALRRHGDLLKMGESEKAEEVLFSLRKRDDMDSKRMHNPLQVAEGALLIDSTDIGIDEVVNLIVSKIKESI